MGLRQNLHLARTKLTGSESVNGTHRITGIFRDTQWFLLITYQIYLLIKLFEEIGRVVHHVVHHKVTNEPPVTPRPGRLAPDKLLFAKNEFNTLLSGGFAYISRIPWCSPLQMVSQKDGVSWRLWEIIDHLTQLLISIVISHQTYGTSQSYFTVRPNYLKSI